MSFLLQFFKVPLKEIAPKVNTCIAFQNEIQEIKARIMFLETQKYDNKVRDEASNLKYRLIEIENTRYTIKRMKDQIQELEKD